MAKSSLLALTPPECEEEDVGMKVSVGAIDVGAMDVGAIVGKSVGESDPGPAVGYCVGSVERFAMMK
jgi:hypothetical protein